MPISKALTTALIDGTGAITPANVTVSTNNLTVGTALYVANNGNIGVGVTPNTYWANVPSVIQLGAVGSLYSTTFPTTSLATNYYIIGSTYYYLSNNFATQYYQSLGAHVWRYANSGTANNSFTFSEAMRISETGAVTVNTQLTVGTIDGSVSAISGYSNGGYGVIGYANTGTGAAGYSDGSAYGIFGRSNTNFAGYFRSITGPVLYAGNNTTEFMRIAANGNIGVGNSTPNYKLDVNGNMAVNTNLIVGSYNLNDVGIRGYSNNSIGVFGGSNSSHGVYGQTSTGYGVIAYSNSTGTCILAQNDTSGIATYVLANTGTGAHIHSKTGNPLFVGNVGSTFVSVTANGRVGIGTTTPSYPLVVSDNGAKGIEFIPNSDTTVSELLAYNRSGAVYSVMRYRADSHQFYGNTIERMRIGTAGVQSIQFDPNQVANTNANTLDDYEEGTWTPTLECSTTNPTLTYSQQSGNYTKIGRVVVLKFDVRWSGMTNVGSGNLWIGGVPFTTHANYDAGVISEKFSVSFPSGTYTCHIETFASTTKLYLTAHPITTGPSTVLTSAQLITGQSGYLIGGITYIV